MSNSKTIVINTTRYKFFRQFLELIKSIPPFNKLRPKELDVLAELMYQNDRYSDLEPKIRQKIIFDTKTREEIRNGLNMTKESFNNNLSILRKHGVLSKENELMPFLRNILYDDKYVVEFVFKETQP
jgi:DNA-binding MarR family transcriptional regulator